MMTRTSTPPSLPYPKTPTRPLRPANIALPDIDLVHPPLPSDSAPIFKTWPDFLGQRDGGLGLGDLMSSTIPR